MSLLLRWLISAVALLGITQVVPGFRVASFGTALVASLILGLVNVIVRPILLILTLPLNILTLGLFTFVINALMLLLAASLVSGFSIAGFWPALLAALILSIVNLLLGPMTA